MYIEKQDQKDSDAEKIRRFEKLMSDPEDIEEEDHLLEYPDDSLISEHSQDVHTHWRAPEFEVFERDKKWYMYVSAILFLIIGYAVYTDSIIMAITFILIGVVGYIYINKDPRTLDFMITDDGIMAGKELFSFENLISFWIFYEPEGKKVISLRTKSHLVPYVYIPIHEEDPVEIRETLMQFIPEVKQEEGIIEIAERLLRL